jgi:hypothetical protein
LTIDQIKGLALALQYLYFTHSRLLKYMGMGFLKQLKPNTPLAQVSLICYAFANLKVNNPAFWLAVSEWINKNLEFV